MRHRISALAFALALVASVFAAPAFADDAADPAADALGPPVTPTISSLSPTYLSASSSLSLRISLTAGPAGATGVDSTVSITTSPLADAAGIDAFLANPSSSPTRGLGHAQPAELVMGVAQPVGTLQPGSTGGASLTVDPATLALPTGTNGVYGVVVTTRADGASPVVNSFVIAWLDARLPTVDISVVATVSGSPERTQALLTAASDERVTLLVDTTALAHVEDGAQQVDSREVYGLPAGNTDIVSAIHGGANSLLQYSLERTAANEPTGLPWLAVPATLDQTVVDEVHAQGAAGIMAGLRLEHGRPVTDAAVVDVQASMGGATPTILVNERLSSVLASSPKVDATAPARLVAESALFAASLEDSEGPAVAVVSPGDSWVVDGARASEEVSALLAAPWVRPISLSTVLGGADRELADVPSSPVTMRDVPPEVLVNVQQTVSRLADLAVATDQPSTILDGPGVALLASMGLPARSDTPARATAIDSALADATAVIDSVRVTSGSELTLVSSSGNVPITVRNDLDATVTVVVVMTSRSPNLVVQDSPVAVIPPQSEITVLVPVTGVSNDDVNVTVALRNEEGATLAVAKTLDVRVRAAWGNAVTAIATGGLIVLLAAGLWRTIRRGRSDTRVGPLTEDPQAPPRAP